MCVGGVWWVVGGGCVCVGVLGIDEVVILCGFFKDGMSLCRCVYVCFRDLRSDDSV